MRRPSSAGGSPRDRQRRFGDAEAMAFVRHTVRDCAGQRTDGGGEHALERSAASDRHVLRVIVAADGRVWRVRVARTDPRRH